MLREIEYEKDLPVKVQVLQIQQCPWHIHDDIQIIYVLEGEVELKLTYARYRLTKNNIHFIHSADVHGFRALSDLSLIHICDKIVPGMTMAAVRLNIPAVVCSGGPMMSGLVKGEETSLSKMFEAVGARKANLIDDDELLEFEEHVCPGCGSCSGMYTANSMNCLSEAVGIALPGNGTIPAVDSGRIRLAKHAGMAIMNLVEKDIKARDIINEKSLRNALACDMALGCSSNSVLHLLAIANEAGVELNLDIFNEFSAKVPNLCHLAPAGGTHMHDLNNAGGLPAVFSELTKKGLKMCIRDRSRSALISCPASTLSSPA